jgi:hypothetical protein
MPVTKEEVEDIRTESKIEEELAVDDKDSSEFEENEDSNNKVDSKLFVEMLKEEGPLASNVKEEKNKNEDDQTVNVGGKVKLSNKKAKEWIASAKKTSINKLNLPKEVIKDLKTAGYKFVEDVIEDGPEGLTDNLMIDPEEVVLISKEIKKFLEETHTEEN